MSSKKAAVEKIKFLEAIRMGEEEADEGKVISLAKLEQNLRFEISKSRDQNRSRRPGK